MFTWHEPVEFLGYLDEDDPKLNSYDRRSEAYGKNYIGPRLPLGPAYQFLYEKCKGDIVMMCADDVVFKNKGWDTKVKEAMPKDLIGVVSCNELVPGRREDGHPFIGRKFIELMGYICYPQLKHSCVDSWVRDVATGAGRFFYLPDVHIEHVHPKFQKGEWDDTYRENTKDIQKADGDVYRHGRQEIKQAIMRVNTYLNENKLVHRLGQ